MSMTDPIADFLTRIRNGIMAAHETVEIPSSRLKREMARILTEQGSGSIINTTSVAARSGGGGGAGLYGSAKGFVSTMTRVLAKELAPFGARANAVAPGVIMTPFHQRYSTAEQLEGARQGIPMGRIGTPEECAEAILWLLSSEAAYMTGAILPLSGGR